jgi:hypothetical protein
MLRLLLFIHHTALYTSCIAHFNIGSYLCTEPKTEIQVEQVQWVFGSPQASSCDGANIVVIKVSPGASHPILEFYFLINIFMLRIIMH